MSERVLDADSFLVELDGRLRAIQSELRPGAPVPAMSVQQMDSDPPPARRGRAGPLSALLGRARSEPDPGDEPSHQDAPPADDTTELLAQVRALTETQARLLEASERLLEAFARAVQSPPPEPASPPGLFTATTTAARRTEVEVSAGPFSDTESLREFERALERLEPVRRVTVRGYEGSDRAIFDVEIAH
jgi:hypothetical protein